MTLADRPPFISHWATGIKPEVLQSLGHLAIVSAQIEEEMHKIYWRHAGLDECSGPIVTDILNPKRLAEDIIKLVRLDPRKQRVLADLEVLFKEFEDLNERRNQCLHWIWSVAGQEVSKGGPMISETQPAPPLAYKLMKPKYRQKGKPHIEYDAKALVQLCDDCSWLLRRLTAHALPEDDLLRNRAELDNTGAIGNYLGRHWPFSDVFFPAPWLDKPASPESTPSHPQGQKK